jgi:chromosome segregation ATPase
MSIHIHLTVADLLKMATATADVATADGLAAAAVSDAAAAARVRQEAAHQEELKELRQLIEQQKMEITHLKWDSFAAAAKEQTAFDTQIKDLTDRLNGAVYQHNVRAKEDAATMRHLRTALDNALEAEQEAMEDAKESKVKWNQLAEDFDTSTTFYKMKLEEAEENCESLKKELKEESETHDEVSRRECALGQRVRDLNAVLEKPNTCAIKAEANFMRLCAAIDITLKDSPDYRKKLWDQYMSTDE